MDTEEKVLIKYVYMLSKNKKMKFYDRYWKNKEGEVDFPYKWPELSKLIPRKKNITVLDYGCAKGFIISKMIEINPSLKIVGADVSEVAINVARKKLKNNKFFLLEEGKKLPFKSREFDFVVSLDVIEHVYDAELIFSEFSRILKPNGKILISTPYNGLLKNILIALFFFEEVFTPYTPHIRFYTKKSLIKCLRKVGLQSVGFGYYGRFFPFSKGMYVLATKLKARKS